jgi:hypothetical protein
VVASVRTVSARHARPPAGDWRWPLTSCAHRLRKPHRTDEPLTPAVTRRLRKARDPPVASKTPPRATSKRRPSGAPPRQARRHHRLFKATTPHEPERLPSNWPVPCGAGGLDHACLFNLRRSRPAPCRLPRAAPAPSRDGWSLQTISSFAGLPRSLAHARGSDGTHRTGRKMLLSDFCDRPHVTSTLTDDSILEFAPLDTLRSRKRLESLWRREPLSGQPEWSFA